MVNRELQVMAHVAGLLVGLFLGWCYVQVWRSACPCVSADDLQNRPTTTCSWPSPASVARPLGWLWRATAPVATNAPGWLRMRYCINGRTCCSARQFRSAFPASGDLPCLNTSWTMSWHRRFWDDDLTLADSAMPVTGLELAQEHHLGTAVGQTTTTMLPAHWRATS